MLRVPIIITILMYLYKDNSFLELSSILIYCIKYLFLNNGILIYRVPKYVFNYGT